MNKETGITAYTWVNDLYMSHKQLGIQSAHALCDISVSFEGNKIYKKWAKEHKTIIMFSGKNSATLEKIFTIVRDASINLSKSNNSALDQFDIETMIPFTIFNEDMESLGGAATCTALILPDGFRSLELSENDKEVDNSTEAYYNRLMGKILDSSRQSNEFNIFNFIAWMNNQRLA